MTIKLSPIVDIKHEKIIDDILGIETTHIQKEFIRVKGKKAISSHQRNYSKSTIIYNQTKFLRNCFQKITVISRKQVFINLS